MISRVPPPTPADGKNARRIDKSQLTFGEPRRVRDKDHLIFVGAQACAACGARPSDTHHVRYAQLRALGAKVGDEFTVPLCRVRHSELHAAGNEKAWWHQMGLDPVVLTKELWDESHAPPIATPNADRRLPLNGASDV